MCHILLFLPFLAIPIFWFAPLTIAAPVYSVILIVSVVIYILAIRAMRQPIVVGPEALVHQIGEVLDKDTYLYRVRLHNEIWQARSKDDIRPGDAIEVTAVEGTTLQVRKIPGIAQTTIGSK